LPPTLLHSYMTATGNDRAMVKFNLKADLSPVFHWNVKQLFVFITAEYNNTNSDNKHKNVNNSVVIWDKIIKSKAKAKINLTNKNAKYPLIDQGSNLRGMPVTYKLSWNVVPYTGYLYVQDSPTTFTIELPNSYTTRRPNLQKFKYEEALDWEYS